MSVVPNPLSAPGPPTRAVPALKNCFRAPSTKRSQSAPHVSSDTPLGGSYQRIARTPRPHTSSRQRLDAVPILRKATRFPRRRPELAGRVPEQRYSPFPLHLPPVLDQRLGPELSSLVATRIHEGLELLVRDLVLIDEEVIESNPGAYANGYPSAVSPPETTTIPTGTPSCRVSFNVHSTGGSSMKEIGTNPNLAMRHT